MTPLCAMRGLAAYVLARFAVAAVAIEQGEMSDGFVHGVGSFDPGQTGIVLWTRYTPAHGTVDSLSLDWELWNTEHRIWQRGTVNASVVSDYTISVKVDGLRSNTRYAYRFSVGGNHSPIGDTMTLPAPGETDSVKIAVVSCANYQAGLFNVYGAIAESDVDVVIHLGDYIYEYAPGGYGTTSWTYANNRSHTPDKETVALDDYRMRYKQYRSDANQQLVHQRKPFIVIYDDHESANDAWKDGAENHDPATEGNWSERKAASLQAWHEYFPSATAMGEINYRSFQFGDIFSLFMMDTRLVGRQEQLQLSSFFDASGNFDAAAFGAAVQDPTRSLLGARQLSWLQSELSSSQSAWQVLGSQVLMGKYWLPPEMAALSEQVIAAIDAGIDYSYLLVQLGVLLQDLSAIKLKMQAGIEVSDTERARVQSIPLNMDAWDGYMFERELVYGAAAGKNLVAIAGDTHNAWWHQLTTASGVVVGHEFATSSVSSPGLEGTIGTVQAEALAGAISLLSDDTLYTDQTQRGYLHMTFTRDQVTSSYVYMSTVLDANYTTSLGYSTTVNATYPPPPPEACRSGCQSKTQPWSIKCGWTGCSGCTQCEGQSSETCKAGCASKIQPWAKKCSWTNCAGCTQCPEGCRAACASRTPPWSKKCKWDTCKGCSQCTGGRLLRGSSPSL